MRIASLILSGGLSSRMGTDKGLLLHRGKTWVDCICDLIKSFSDIYISVGAHNQSAYLQKGFKRLVLDGDYNKVAGPIKGIKSSLHLLHHYDGILVIPCDMIALNSDVLKGLAHCGTSAYYETSDGSFPLPFFIQAGDYVFFEQGDFENRSLKSVLSELVRFPIQTTDIELFKNFNSPSDLI